MVYVIYFYKKYIKPKGYDFNLITVKYHSKTITTKYFLVYLLTDKIFILIVGDILAWLDEILPYSSLKTNLLGCNYFVEGG